MRAQLGARLPTFTPAELAVVRGSNDFFGINTYGSNYIRHLPGTPAGDDFYGHVAVLDQNASGTWIGPETESAWLRPNPGGFRRLLGWLSARYGRPCFFVTENGTSVKGENELARAQILDDGFRVDFFRGYVAALADACALDGIDVRGYTAWSLLECVSSFLLAPLFFAVCMYTVRLLLCVYAILAGFGAAVLNVQFTLMPCSLDPRPRRHLVPTHCLGCPGKTVLACIHIALDPFHPVGAFYSSALDPFHPVGAFYISCTYMASNPANLLQQLRVARRLPHALRRDVRRLRGRAEAVPQEERDRGRPHLCAVHCEGVDTL